MRAVPAELPELVIDRAHAALAHDVEPGPVRQTWLDNDGRLVATGGYDRGLWWMRWSGLAVYRFGESGAASAVPAPQASDADLHDIYVRGVLPVVLLARGCEALHASAIEADGGVAAFCATSGTGKSTLALAASAAGARQFADDVLVYRWVGDQPVAISLPFPVRVDPAIHQAGEARSPAVRVEPRRHAPLRRVYQLRRDAGLDPGEPRFTPVPPERRFELLLAHAHPFEMGPAARHRQFLEGLMRLARTVEVWQCAFAPSVGALPVLAARVSAHART